MGWPAANLAAFTQTGTVGVTGHYTQLIWGATTKVGCGYVSYVDPTSPQTPYRQVSNFAIRLKHKLAKQTKSGASSTDVSLNPGRGIRW